MIIPVILSGGAGARLWPLSRELYPKQFLPLAGEQTMLQETITRLHGLSDSGAPLLVCNESHRFLAAEQMRAIGVAPAAIILEPVGRNTAPAVAVAALLASVGDADPTLLVLPADHVIADGTALRAAIETGGSLAEAGRLLTFGIVPDKPETGYGYIRVGSPLSRDEGCGIRDAGRGTRDEDNQVPTTSEGECVRVPRPASRVPGTAYAVAQFVEKPDTSTAQRYVESGDYFWNSGMFMFRASTFLAELERYAPDILEIRRAHV